jgi:hypothetical protein
MRRLFNNPVHLGDRQISGGNVSRPRAADDFATIAARVAELRRERELAAKQDASAAGDTGDGPKVARSPDGRARTDKGELPGLGVGRRYLPARQR